MYLFYINLNKNPENYIFYNLFFTKPSIIIKFGRLIFFGIFKALGINYLNYFSSPGKIRKLF